MDQVNCWRSIGRRKRRLGLGTSEGQGGRPGRRNKVMFWCSRHGVSFYPKGPLCKHRLLQSLLVPSNHPDLSNALATPNPPSGQFGVGSHSGRGGRPLAACTGGEQKRAQSQRRAPETLECRIWNRKWRLPVPPPYERAGTQRSSENAEWIPVRYARGCGWGV